MLQALDGPSAQDAITVTNSTVVEIKVGAQALDERKVITLQTDGKIRVFFGDGGSAPSVSDVLNKGLKQGKNTIRTYEASALQDMYMISDTGANVEVIVIERA